MEVFKLSEMKGGWFVGNFQPAAYSTGDCEVCYKFHPKGEKWPVHYHKLGTEINLLVRGKMVVQGRMLEEGDVFVIKPYEVADPEFLEDCEVVVVKTPSCPGDKYNCES